MATECERKFLLNDEAIIDGMDGIEIEQGYIAINDKVVIRARLKGDEAFITVKQARFGMSRLEFDYVIPVEEAREMMENFAIPPVIKKTRYEIQVGQHTWEIDKFYGENEGLVVAEIELDDEGEAFEKPSWIGREVTDDDRYYNAQLVVAPFKSWKSGD